MPKWIKMLVKHNFIRAAAVKLVDWVRNNRELGAGLTEGQVSVCPVGYSLSRQY